MQPSDPVARRVLSGEQGAGLPEWSHCVLSQLRLDRPALEGGRGRSLSEGGSRPGHGSRPLYPASALASAPLARPCPGVGPAP